MNLERFFSALSDRTRLRLINLISNDEICVCFLVEVLGELQPKISRHLGILRGVGIVEARREGKWMHYRLAKQEDAFASRVLRETVARLKQDHEMENDVVRLIKVCCSSGMPVELVSAPIPGRLSLGDHLKTGQRDRRPELDNIYSSGAFLSI